MSVRVAPTTEATAPAGGQGAAGRRRRLAFHPSIRTAIAVVLVVTATLAAGVAALASYSADRQLSVGTLRLSVDPGHRGALDLYVPVVDWGARFPAVRVPARLKVEVRAVNRDAVARIAEGQHPDLKALRREAHAAVASYIRELLAVVLAAALIVGLLAAFAVRARTGPRLRITVPVAIGTALAGVALLAVLLPPRGTIDHPQYYAHGPDIPRALQAIEDASTSSRHLSEELDTQLVGLARLVQAPAGRRPLGALPRVTLASDLHNNLLALPALQSAAAGGPLFFPGDLTDSGSPIETRLVQRVVSAGHPFVFVTGNHDSDVLVHQLVKEGAIVLTETGRVGPHGPRGPVIVRIAGLRVAGYSDPFQRLARSRFDAITKPKPTPAQQNAFWTWLRPIANRVDVVMVHEPALAQVAIAQLRLRPRTHPIVFLVGHTHVASLDSRAGVVVLNGGSIGAGGTGNLAERTNLGLARLTYSLKPRFAPLAADLVTINPDTGAATAERRRLDAAKP